MDSITYTKLRSELKAALDRVCDEHQPMVVERQKGGDVVLIAREDYESLEETAYLLRSPANAKRLLTAVRRKPRARRSFASVKALRRAAGL